MQNQLRGHSKTSDNERAKNTTPNLHPKMVTYQTQWYYNNIITQMVDERNYANIVLRRTGGL